MTGVMARSVGIKKDLRLSTKHNYSGYNTVPLRSFTGINGDCYDRYLIRMLEMAESLNVINYTTNKLLSNKSNTNLVYQQLVNKKQNIQKKKCIYGRYYKSFYTLTFRTVHP